MHSVLVAAFAASCLALAHTLQQTSNPSRPFYDFGRDTTVPAPRVTHINVGQSSRGPQQLYDQPQYQNGGPYGGQYSFNQRHPSSAQPVRPFLLGGNQQPAYTTYTSTPQVSGYVRTEGASYNFPGISHVAPGSYGGMQYPRPQAHQSPTTYQSMVHHASPASQYGAQTSFGQNRNERAGYFRSYRSDNQANSASANQPLSADFGSLYK